MSRRDGLHLISWKDTQLQYDNKLNRSSTDLNGTLNLTRLYIILPEHVTSTIQRVNKHNSYMYVTTHDCHESWLPQLTVIVVTNSC